MKHAKHVTYEAHNFPFCPASRNAGSFGATAINVGHLATTQSVYWFDRRFCFFLRHAGLDSACFVCVFCDFCFDCSNVFCTFWMFLDLVAGYDSGAEYARIGSKPLCFYRFCSSHRELLYSSIPQQKLFVLMIRCFIVLVIYNENLNIRKT